MWLHDSMSGRLGWGSYRTTCEGEKLRKFAIGSNTISKLDLFTCETCVGSVLCAWGWVGGFEVSVAMFVPTHVCVCVLFTAADFVQHSYASGSH